MKLDFDRLHAADSGIKNHRPLPYAQDCLARAVASHARWKASNEVLRFSDLDTIEVGPVDHALANQIKKYYCDQLLMKKLRGSELTRFQSDLWGLLSGRDTPEDRHVGMLYQVPFFYAEDLMRDALSREFNGVVKEFGMLHTRNRMVVTPHSKIFVTRRGSNRYEYWFVDQEQRPAVLSVQHTNPLRGLINSLHQSGKPIDFIANVKAVQDRHRPGFVFVTMINPEFAGVPN